MKIQGIEKILTVDGSLALPAIGFAADPDNGLYRIGADSWVLVVGGVAVLTLSSTGIVGGANLRIAIPSTGYFDFNGGYAASAANIYGAGASGMNLYGNLALTDATARSVTVKVLDTTNDAWRDVFTATGGAGVTNATALVGFHGAAVAQAATIADPAGGATVDAEARTAINAILVVLENKGLTASV